MGRMECPICGEILIEDKCESCGFEKADVSKSDLERMEMDESVKCGKNCDDCPLRINVAVFLNAE